MNWKLILLLCPLGVITGFAIMYIPSVKVEQILWLVTFMVSAIVLARYADGKFFLNGFVLGLINYTIAATMHVIMYKTYIIHHTDIGLFTEHDPQAVNPRVALLVIEFVKGIVMSVISGGFAYVIGRGMNKSLRG